MKFALLTKKGSRDVTVNRYLQFVIVYVIMINTDCGEVIQDGIGEKLYT